MKVINENLSITDFEAWSGAIHTKQTIIYNNKQNDFDFMIEELYTDGLTDTALNDLLWYDSDWVLEQLGIEIEA
jgi:hypothetical protein